MFLSNWLIFKIVLAAVTGLVDYPLAADVLLVYDGVNKLYLSGNSLDYVSNIVLYKGETSYDMSVSSTDFLNSKTLFNNNAGEKMATDGWFNRRIWSNGDGTRFVVLAQEYGSYGRAYIYEYSGGSWTQVKYYDKPNQSGRMGLYCVMNRAGNRIWVDGNPYAYLWERGSSEWPSSTTQAWNDASNRGVSMNEAGTILTSCDAGWNDYWGRTRVRYINSSGNWASTDLNGSSQSQWGFENVLNKEGDLLFTTSTGAGVKVWHRTDAYGASWSHVHTPASDNSFNSNSQYIAISDTGYSFVCGNSGYDSSRGRIYFYSYDGNSNPVQLTFFNGENQNDQFGLGMSMSGDGTVAAVSAHTYPSNANDGRVYVYVKSGGSWSLSQTLDKIQTGEKFGSGVALSNDGKTLFVGASENDLGGTNAGCVYVFKKDIDGFFNYYITQPGTYRADLQICGIDYKTNEVEVTTLNPGNAVYTNDLKETSEIDHGTTYTLKACSVSLDGTRIALGADNGRVKVYHLETGVWTLKKEYTKSTSFGTQVCLNDAGTRLFVSDPADNSNTGKVYVYDYSGSAWGNSETHSWTSPNGSTSDYFGGVAGKGIDCNSDGTRLLVANGYVGSQKAYIFDHNGSSWNASPTKSWSSGITNWGITCALNDAGDRAFIGYYNGVDIFHYDGSNWPTSATKNYTGSDIFGTSLTINGAGTRLLVGSYGYSSSGGKTDLYDYVGSSWNTSATQTINAPYGSSSLYGHGINMSRDGKRYLVAAHNASTYFSAGGFVDMMEDTTGSGSFTLKQIFKPDQANENMGSYQFQEGLCLDQKGYTAVILSTGTDVSRIYSSNPIPTLDFDNYNKLSLTNTPTYTSSKLTYGSNVYDIGTLTDKLFIDKTGEYASLTFDTSSNVAYFSNISIQNVNVISDYIGEYGIADYSTYNGANNAGWTMDEWSLRPLRWNRGDRNNSLYVPVPASSSDPFAIDTMFHFYVQSLVANGFSSNSERFPFPTKNGVLWEVDMKNIELSCYNNNARVTGSSLESTYGIGGNPFFVLQCNKNSANEVTIYIYYSRTSSTGKIFDFWWSISNKNNNVNNNETICLIQNVDLSNDTVLKYGWYKIDKTEGKPEFYLSIGGQTVSEKVSFSLNNAYRNFHDETYGGCEVADPVGPYDNNYSSHMGWPFRHFLASDTRSGVGDNNTDEGRTGLKRGLIFDMMYFKYNNVFEKIPKIDFDTYNKLSVQNITPTSTTLRLDSNTYDIGTATNIYIESAGTYTVAMKGSDKFALDSTVVGAIQTHPDAAYANYRSIGAISAASTSLHNENITTTYSVTMWAKKINGSYFFRTTPTDGNTAPYSTHGILRWNDGKISHVTWTSNNSLGITYTTTLDETSKDEWHFYGFEFEGTTTKLHLDGAAPITGTTGLNGQTHNRIRFDDPTVFSTGGARLAEFAVYNRALTDAEFVSIYNNGKPNGPDNVSSGRVSWFKCLSGAMATNSGSGGDFDATITEDTDVPDSWKYTPPSLNFDTYNKLTFTGADTDSTYKLKYGSNTYDLGTISNVYIAYPGTYSAEIKGTTNFAFANEVTQEINTNETFSVNRVYLKRMFMQNPQTTDGGRNFISITLYNGDIPYLWSSIGSSNYDGWEMYGQATYGGYWALQAFDDNDSTSFTWSHDRYGYNASGNVDGVPAVEFSNEYAYRETNSSVACTRIRFKASINGGGFILVLNQSKVIYVYSSTAGNTRQGVEGIDHFIIPQGTNDFYINLVKGRPSLTFDGYNKLTLNGLESGSTLTTLMYGSNTYDIGTASNVYISETGTYEAESNDTNTFALTKNVVGVVDAIEELPPLISWTNLGTTLASDNGGAYTFTADGLSYSQVSGSGNNYITNTGNERLYIEFESLRSREKAFTFEYEIYGSAWKFGAQFGNLLGNEIDSIGLHFGTGNSTTLKIHSPNVTLVDLGFDENAYGTTTWVKIKFTREANSNTIKLYINDVYINQITADSSSPNNTSYTDNGIKSRIALFRHDWSGLTNQYAASGTRIRNIKVWDVVGIKLPSLTHDGYKLVVSGITPTSTTLKYFSNTYEIGTATNIYVENTGAYTAEIGNATDFALTSNVVSSVAQIEPVITNGYFFGHALTYDGKLYGWGENSNGELGVGDNTDKTVPTLCTGITQGEVVSIWNQSIRGQSRWAKTRDGRIWVTGDHDSYCLPGSSADFTTFTDVSAQFGDYTQTSNNVVWASGSERATQVLMENGDVWSFGDDAGAAGVLGQGASPTSDRTPRKLNVSNITKITYGGDLVLALDSSNVVWMWGGNGIGSSNLGWGRYNVPTNIMSTGTNSLTSLLATDSETVVDIESSYYSMYALTDKGTVYCTGHNAAGQLGQGNTTAKTSSDGWVKIEYFTSNAITVNKLYVGGGNPHVFADTSDGWYAFGVNGTGTLGLGDTANKLSPVKFTGVSNIKKFAVGYETSYAITEDGKYYAWGRGTNYARGDAVTGDISYPKYIDTLPNILAPSFEFDGYDKVFAHMKPTAFVYELYIAAKVGGVGTTIEINWHELSSTTMTLTSSMMVMNTPYRVNNVVYGAGTSVVSGLFDGSTGSTNRVQIFDPNMGVGQKIATLTTIKELANLTFTTQRPGYMPGWKIVLNGTTILEDSANNGTSGSPDPFSITKTLPPLSNSLTKYTKDTHTYDTNQAKIITVSDPGTYDAQLKDPTNFTLTSATIPATSTTGLYTWAFHHGNFDNAYGDGDILTARDNGRFYADTPSYTGDIGTITPTLDPYPVTYTFPFTSAYPVASDYPQISSFTNGNTGSGGTTIANGYMTMNGNNDTNDRMPSWETSSTQNEYSVGFDTYFDRSSMPSGSAIFFGGQETGGRFEVTYNTSTHKLYVYHAMDGGSGTTSTGSTVIADTTWYNIKIVFNFPVPNSYVKVYIDNVLEIYHTMSSSWTNNTPINSWYMGAKTNSNYAMGGMRIKNFDVYEGLWPLTEDVSKTTYTFTPASTLTANVLMVAGGGGGGGVNAGGGGAGGLVYSLNETISPVSKTIVVGNGGNGGKGYSTGLSEIGIRGNDTIFLSYTASGGGGGGSQDSSATTQIDGGSGGGNNGNHDSGNGGTSTQNAYSGKGFGNDGGDGVDEYNGGGGGGAGGGGGNAAGQNNAAGTGGIGKNYGYIFGTNYGDNGWFAGGGGGASQTGNGTIGLGGKGGGGDGFINTGSSDKSNDGQTHTGGGGGAAGYSAGNSTRVGGNGSSGIVLLQTNVATPNVNNEVKILEPYYHVLIQNPDDTHFSHLPNGKGGGNDHTGGSIVPNIPRADGSVSNVYYASSSGYFYAAQAGSLVSTVEGIFYPIEQQRYDNILEIGHNSTNDVELEMASDGTAKLYRNNGATLIAAGTKVCFTVGKWHHIALTLDSGGNAVGYVNGYPVVSATYASAILPGSRTQMCLYRTGVTATFRKFLMYYFKTYNSVLNHKQIMQLASSVGLGPKLEYDGLNTLNVVNAEPGSEITIYKKDEVDTTNLYIVACNSSSYTLSNAATYYAQIKGTDTFTITKSIDVAGTFPLYQYPPLGGTTTNLTTDGDPNDFSTWTISGAPYGNGQYRTASSTTSVSGNTPYNVFTNNIYYGFSSTTSTTGTLVFEFPEVKTIRKYVLYPIDTAATTTSVPDSNTDPTLLLNNDNTNRPKSWTLEAGQNGIDWVVLDTVVNQPPSIYGDVHTISSPGSYLYYRINVSQNNGGTGLKIGEFQLWGDLA